MSDTPRKVEVNWVQAVAGALAATSSAVLLSTVGVAGTIIGAALGSLVATVGTAVYSPYIAASRAHVAKSHAAAAARVERARRGARQATSRVDADATGEQQELDQAQRGLSKTSREVREAAEPRPAVNWRQTLSGLPWKRLLLAAAATFLAAMLLILAFEMLTGRAVSSYTGGSDDRPRTSVPGWGQNTRPKPETTPTQRPTRTEEPQPSAVSPSASENTENPTSSPTEAPTTGPTTALSPSVATDTPAPTPGATTPGATPPAE